MSAIIKLRGVSKRFGQVQAVDEVTLEIGEGELFALLGPSGCGKTTLLRLIAGLEAPDAGQILIDGQDVAEVPANRRPVNMVFQSYALFPHMSVETNVGYGLKVAGVAAAERARRVGEVLELVRMQGLGARRPDELSGGQRQRVAVARALVMRPKVLLLDEPLSALDAKLREQMRFELAQLQAEVGVTFVLVTHDQQEALALATRCAVMDQGKLVQTGSPRELYERPATRFVADFIGQVNLFEGIVLESGLVETPGIGQVRTAAEAPPGAAVWIALRPEQIALSADGPGIEARLVRTAFLGGDCIHEVALRDGRRVRVRRSSAAPPLGETVRLSWDPDAPVVLTA